jgi:tRNA-binding EMAP/Myf-like protein
MKEIVISNGMICSVDDEDFEELSQFKWTALKSKTHNTTYARRTAKLGIKQETILMHRQVLGLTNQDGKLIDHIDKNGLNNQKKNLRITTKQINALNSNKPILNRTGFIGVTEAKNGRFSVKIKANSKDICLGTFDTAEEAARSYDKKAIALFNIHARLNFPEEAKCIYCYHSLHSPGQCNFDSCGESEVIISTEKPTFEENFDGYQIDSYYGYDDF